MHFTGVDQDQIARRRCHFPDLAERRMRPLVDDADSVLVVGVPREMPGGHSRHGIHGARRQTRFVVDGQLLEAPAPASRHHWRHRVWSADYRRRSRRRRLRPWQSSGGSKTRSAAEIRRHGLRHARTIPQRSWRNCSICEKPSCPACPENPSSPRHPLRYRQADRSRILPARRTRRNRQQHRRCAPSGRKPTFGRMRAVCRIRRHGSSKTLE